jgi:hypothetical protein
MTVLRSTQEIVQASFDADPNLRSTQEIVQVSYYVASTLRSTQEIVQASFTQDSDVRLYQQYIEVLYKESTTEQLTADITASATVGADLKTFTYLTTGITASATVSADLDRVGTERLLADLVTSLTVTCNITLPGLKGGFLGTGTLTGIITGKRQFTADIDCTADLIADVLSYVRLTAGISATGDVVADVRENIEYLEADITATGDVVSILNIPWHPGNTLDLTHSAEVDLVTAIAVSNTLNLTQSLNLVFGQRFFYPSHTITFTQDVQVIHVLPTKTASNSLVLTQTLSEYRAVDSYLTLTQLAIGTIFFIEGVASNDLNLTDSVSTAGTVFNLTISNQLNLTHSVTYDLVTSESVSSTLSLTQNIVYVQFGTDTYTLLQAPFELIQTTVVLPNPLLDDNENIVSDLVLRRSMDNTAYTYVKTSNNKRLRYTFVLSRMKALELEGFFNSYNGADIKMINWKGEIWKVKLITNPIDFVQTRRNEPGGDRTDVNLEFEGELLNV